MPTAVLIGKTTMQFYVLKTALKIEGEGQIQGNRHRDKCRGTEIQNPLSICSATLDFRPPFGVFLTYRLWKKKGTCCSHLSTCSYLPFHLQNHHFDFMPCWKWQPACIFLVFSRRNSVAVEGVCTMHGELTPVLYPSYTENPSPCCTSTLTNGDNFSFNAH